MCNFDDNNETNSNFVKNVQNCYNILASKDSISVGYLLDLLELVAGEKYKIQILKLASEFILRFVESLKKCSSTFIKFYQFQVTFIKLFSIRTIRSNMLVLCNTKMFNVFNFGKNVE